MRGWRSGRTGWRSTCGGRGSGPRRWWACAWTGARTGSRRGGVGKAGGASLPLDPEYPAGRLGFMLADSRAAVLVGTAALVQDLPAGRIRTVVVDDPVVVAGLAAVPPVRPPVVVAAGQLAYVIYTSGSTGRPKGVLVSHGSVVNLVAAQRPVFGIGRGDVVLQFAPFSFDASAWELVMALVGGGTLVVATPQERSEPGQLAALVAAAGV